MIDRDAPDVEIRAFMERYHVPPWRVNCNIFEALMGVDEPDNTPSDVVQQSQLRFQRFVLLFTRLDSAFLKPATTAVMIKYEAFATALAGAPWASPEAADAVKAAVHEYLRTGQRLRTRKPDSFVVHKGTLITYFFPQFKGADDTVRAMLNPHQ